MSERRYGGEGTIHRTGHVDVEVDKKGHVVAVWFRCMVVPFKAVVVNKERAREMEQMYKDHPLPPLSGFIMEDQ